jgi:hypothetical protein
MNYRKLYVYLLAVAVLVAAVFVAAQTKAPTKKGTQKASVAATKGTEKQTTGPVTVHINDCIADKPSIDHLNGPITFVADDQDYYIFIEKENIFKENVHFRLVKHGTPGQTFNPNPPPNGSITSFWWADPMSGCTSKKEGTTKASRNPHLLGSGPNDITVP